MKRRIWNGGRETAANSTQAPFSLDTPARLERGGVDQRRRSRSSCRSPARSTLEFLERACGRGRLEQLAQDCDVLDAGNSVPNGTWHVKEG